MKKTEKDLVPEETKTKNNVFIDEDVKDEYLIKEKNYYDYIKKFSLKEILTYFPVFTERRNLLKFLSYYDIYKKLRRYPGNIIEIGVFKGYGLFTWLHLINTFNPTDRLLKVYGFDTFEGYQGLSTKHDSNNRKIANINNDFKDLYDHILKQLYNHTIMAPLSGIKRFELIKGDIQKTLLPFLNKNPGIRFKIISLDVNLYKPTKHSLFNLENNLVKDGVIILEAYAQEEWGESQAVDEFIISSKFNWELSRPEYYPQPRIMLRKGQAK